ncbi:MAG: hypothetical protein ABSA02_16380 [Trebonia sp.]|jgi:hypothetical protein
MKHTLPMRIAVGAGAVSLAAALGGAGLAAASVRPAAPPKSGTEHFYLMTTQPAASRYSVIATGVFTAGGTDIAGNTTDTVKLPGGTFKINHGGQTHVVKQQFNPTTCLGVFEGTSKFTVGGGTGKYARITGSGNATINFLGIASRTKKGACNFNANPVVNEETITATGHVKL